MSERREWTEEEAVREAISYGMTYDLRDAARQALDRILSDRDSLRAALRRCVQELDILEADLDPQVTDGLLETLNAARQTLTSSEKETQ